MKKIITINVENLSKEEYNLFTQLIEKSKKKKNNIWKPERREKYYYVRNDGEVFHSFYENCCSADCGNYSMGNCFRTREEAEFTVKKLEVIAELKRFAEENNNKELDWNNKNQTKYWLAYDCKNNEILIYNNMFVKHNDIFFSSNTIAEKAIKEIGEERLKKYYFEMEE